MDPIKLDEFRKKTQPELMAELNELKAKVKKLEEERSLPGAKVTDGAPNKLSELEKLLPFLAEVAKKKRAALREAYSNREPPILRLNFQEDPCRTAASPPAFSEDEESEDEEGKEA